MPQEWGSRRRERRHPADQREEHVGFAMWPQPGRREKGALALPGYSLQRDTQAPDPQNGLLPGVGASGRAPQRPHPPSPPEPPVLQLSEPA